MRAPIAGITLATVLILTVPVAAADWILWEQQIRGRPRPVDTYDDKAACVTASQTAAEREAADMQAMAGRALQFTTESRESGTVIQAGKVVAAVYRCWPVGVNP